MTMYSSRPPFNDDPYPWRYWPLYWQSEVREVRYQSLASAIARGGATARYAPRLRYARPQHNPTNPILETFRAAVSSDPEHDWVQTYLATTPEWDHGEVGHARRVLTRLANLADKEN